MVWKPKEKPLTQREAIALARKELAPYWLNSSPLLAAVRSGTEVSAIPLDPSMTEKAWIVIFVDLSTYDGLAAAAYAKEWGRRYAAHGVDVLLAVRASYSFFTDPVAVQRFLSDSDAQLKTVLDRDGYLGEAFHLRDVPRCVLIKDQKILHEQEGSRWHEGMEIKLQEFLRRTDPGLPLPPPFTPAGGAFVADAVKIELGLARGQRIMVSPGRPAPRPEHLKPGELRISGRWTQDQEKIETSDPEAVIAFRSAGPSFALVAQSKIATAEQAIISVEIGGIPAYESYAGADLATEDDGLSIVRVGKAKLHHVLKGLPEKDREITLRFVTANAVPLALYGVRFGL